jgi:hypothetical protein
MSTSQILNSYQSQDFGRFWQLKLLVWQYEYAIISEIVK